MDKNKDRYQNLSNKLNLLNANYSRIKGINGDSMDQDEDCKILLQPRLDLLYKKFSNKATEEEWIYDGSIGKSFPNCSLYGNNGTKGLTMSNIKAFLNAEKMNYHWYCILEDDAEINLYNYSIIMDFIQNPQHQSIDIVLLDNRHFGWGGTCGMLYNSKIIKQLIIDLHPLSSFSIQSPFYGDSNLGNLWDWKLWKYIVYINKNFKLLPCIESGNYPSTIIN